MQENDTRYKTLTLKTTAVKVAVTGDYIKIHKDGRKALDINKIAKDLVKEIIGNGGLIVRGPTRSFASDTYEYMILIHAAAKASGLEGI